MAKFKVVSVVSGWEIRFTTGEIERFAYTSSLIRRMNELRKAL